MLSVVPNKNPDNERDRLAVAVLTVEHGLTQREIAGITGKSQPEVSRLYRQACESGLVVQEVRWPDGQDHSVVDEVAFEGRDELQKRLERLSKSSGARRPLFQKLHIVYGGSDLDDWELFGRKAGVEVGLLARDADVIGVAWGRNVARVVKSMPNQPSTPDKIVIPVAGEPLTHRAEVGATAAAELLANRFGANVAEHLYGVGHRIPAHLAQPDQVKTIRAYLASSSSYRNIFGPSDEREVPLIDRLDMVLTGVGSTETSQASSDPLYLETVAAERAEKTRAREPSLTDAAIGNVSGWWLPRDPADKAASSVVARVNEHWFGISLASLQGCARRAVGGRSPKPGVVVVAAEPTKAETILAAVQAGVVSNLVVSRQLATSLLP